MFAKRWVVKVYDVQDNCVSILGGAYTLRGAKRKASRSAPPMSGWGPLWEIVIEPQKST